MSPGLQGKVRAGGISFNFNVGEFKVVGLDDISKLEMQREKGRGLGCRCWVGTRTLEGH